MGGQDRGVLVVDDVVVVEVALCPSDSGARLQPVRAEDRGVLVIDGAVEVGVARQGIETSRVNWPENSIVATRNACPIGSGPGSPGFGIVMSE